MDDDNTRLRGYEPPAVSEHPGKQGEEAPLTRVVGGYVPSEAPRQPTDLDLKAVAVPKPLLQPPEQPTRIETTNKEGIRREQ